jgi:hypothetical protein
MSERIEKAVSRFQRWGQPRLHWIILAAVACNIPDVLHGPDHQEPIRYWLSWFIIVTGVLSVITLHIQKRKLSSTQTKHVPNKCDDAP